MYQTLLDAFFSKSKDKGISVSTPTPKPVIFSRCLLMETAIKKNQVKSKADIINYWLCVPKHVFYMTPKFESYTGYIF